ncbi:MAG: glycosyltransferase [Burkholderiales bacterium]|nr:glycosyltransferase [Burkholderiales bacterium]
MNKPTLRILGTRGIPAAHGGFETFAEALALYLVEHGWRVVVYCQEDGEGPITEDRWQGVERVHIPVRQQGPLGTIVFDWRSTRHAARHGDLCLTLGYNTAVFSALLRLKGIPNLINMDGIEWRRQKWGRVAKAWFYLNEIAGCLLGNHLIADHPGIKAHLGRVVSGSKITMIPYGADRFDEVDSAPLDAFDLKPGQYCLLIARPEPENSILEIVAAYASKPRAMPLVVLGQYTPEHNAYHGRVLAQASGDVRFIGAVYDKAIVNALRAHCRLYVHGHQVGGTNPSLVEALGAGSPVLAHDNHFNRWVAGDAARYFRDQATCATRFDELLANDVDVADLRAAASSQHASHFTWPRVLASYQRLLQDWLPPQPRGATDRPRIGIDLHVVDGKYQGSRTHVIELFSRVVANSPDIDFFLFLDGPDTLLELAPAFALPNVQRIRMPQTLAPLRLYWQLPRLARKYQLDVLHTQYIMPWPLPCRSMVTIHDVLFETHPQFFERLFILRSKVLIRLAAQRADHVFTVSDFSKREIERLYATAPERLTVIHNGADLDRFYPGHDGLEIVRRRSLQSGNYILSVGRLEPRKNHAILIDAYRQLRADAPPLVLVGQPDFKYDAVFDAIVRHGLRDRVHVLSDVRDDELPALYRHARLFAYPTVAEGFGMPPLEAMASGTPVVSSNATALPEVVGATGLLIDPFDTQGLTNAMQQVLDQPALATRLSKDGRQRALAFAWMAPALRVRESYIAATMGAQS